MALVSFRFLADENVPMPSVLRLRAGGFTVASVLERDPGLPDVDVLALARTEGAILLTFDRDIGELVFDKGVPSPPGVIYLRFVDRDPEEAGRVLAELLKLHADDLAGSFLTYRRDAVRVRPLP